LDRYLEHASLEPYRQELARRILAALERRLVETGLLQT
jgi:hypothetical protein